jgi:cadmium resistance protein CadD (predicted permease)
VFFGIGVPELIILAVVGVVPIGIGMTAVMIKRRAAQLGYASARSYLRAAPRSDLEKRDAADLALKGAVFCLLGMVFAPFVLIGLVPLFYGGRKLVWASMGLGLVDDGDQPGA